MPPSPARDHQRRSLPHSQLFHSLARQEMHFTSLAKLDGLMTRLNYAQLNFTWDELNLKMIKPTAIFEL